MALSSNKTAMKLIKLSDIHYVVVDDSEIKEGDWFINETNNIEQGISNYPYKSLSPECKKITHSTNIDWNEVYYIPLSEVKELIGEVNIEEKAWKYNPFMRVAYIKGYNQCLEDNKEKKWTDADVIRIVEKSRQTGLTAEYLMLSLYSQTEWEVEFVDGKLKLKNT